MPAQHVAVAASRHMTGYCNALTSRIRGRAWVPG